MRNATFLDYRMPTCYDLPMIGMRRTPTSEGSLLLKRLLDLTGAIVGIILLSPIMLATAITIKITDPGPIFFSQVRSGRSGRKFKKCKSPLVLRDLDARKHKLRIRATDSVGNVSPTVVHRWKVLG